ncbi:hypothetical protein OJAV_G00050970 [Oryzias javanicus]|uniref:Uncharacterized protein n=1 Tax=Oryzias javanicus TaxID=123683 RepID=A0A437D8Z9_ORYJA|nr:hypothetical protein OJAV_G00050970 [Oryzias javanicus]
MLQRPPSCELKIASRSCARNRPHLNKKKEAILSKVGPIPNQDDPDAREAATRALGWEGGVLPERRKWPIT